MYWIGGAHFETYRDMDPLPNTRWAEFMCYGPQYLDQLEAQGYDVVFLFDPDRCDQAELGPLGYWSTEEGALEREQEAEAHAEVLAEIKEENLHVAGREARAVFGTDREEVGSKVITRGLK